MEGNNKQNDSFSFVYELFGPKETHSSSSSGVLGSMSSQSPNVLGKEPVLSEVSEKTIKKRWDTILGTLHGGISKGYGGEFHNTQTKDKMSSIYQDQRIEPCNLSSSIFYGGQDIIHHVQSTQNERKNLLPKNGGEDDLSIASRGDWWKGTPARYSGIGIINQIILD
ncbi:E3 ubiquitin-protein ligase RLIM protein [Trifolium repens]|nr:E3 ubiquitin-protein ligase RLIM protein [Trifolium repens]